MSAHDLHPSEKILERYAAVLVDFALGGGRGVQPGEVVRVASPESAKPLYAELQKAVWRAGGHVIGAYQPDDDRRLNLSRDFYELPARSSSTTSRRAYMRGLIDEMDHQVSVIADSDPHALEGVDPARIMRRGEAMRPMLDWRGEKENAGRFSWTLGLYGTRGDGGRGGHERGGVLGADRPRLLPRPGGPDRALARGRQQLEETRARLDALEIERVHVEGEDVDLCVTLGEQRRWLGGRGRNIPSFELFTSPDWRGTEGWIRFNQPLYRYGNLVRGIRLAFADGRVIEASAEENERDADRDDRHRGRRPGGRVLADRQALLADHALHGADALRRERRGPVRQHAHRARSRSYQDAYAGDPAARPRSDWERLGFNSSSVHTDIVSTTDRVVTATLRDGSERVIYRDGEFQLD